MTHGDDAGLILPPRVAPHQVVIVPIFRKEEERAQVAEAIEGITRQLDGQVRCTVDWSENTPGWKFNEWEMRGVPIRLEVGPRDVAQGQAVAVRRDSRAKEPIPLTGLPARLPALLDDVQRALFDRAVAFRASRTHHVKSLDEIAEVIERERGFFWAPWCGSAACEEEVRQRTRATLRLVPLDGGDEGGACLVCGQRAEQTAVFAHSY